MSQDLATACRSIRQMGAGSVVVTLGENGLVYLHGQQFGQLPAFQVEVVDTTGAGDVFHGAFVFGMLQDWPHPVVAEFAAAVAALSSTSIGGRSGAFF